tara:strand:- start:2665 stop:2946 length:282 start_codon:yes stop_codon:yes gene_type:complete
MQTITIGRATYKTLNAAKFLAEHAKCTGKHKRQKSKGSEKRIYSPYGASMSTAEYVKTYEMLNDKSKIAAWDWQPLTEHVTQPEGQDIFEVES